MTFRDETTYVEPGNAEPPLLMREPRDRQPGEKGSVLRSILGLAAIVGLFAWLWIGAGFSYFTIVVGLVVMIFLHELGHFLTARWSGMKVTQFFLFFGPRIFSFHRNGVEYGVRSIPAGAFVRIVGMSNLDECAPEDEPYAYRNATYPRRMWVITAGSMMHFIQGLLLFILVASVVGTADRDSGWEIRRLSEASAGQTVPSVEAGLQPGDRILEIDGQDTSKYQDLVDYVRENPGENINLVVERDGQTIEPEATLARVDANGKVIGQLGVTPKFDVVDRSPVNGVKLFGTVFWGSLEGLAQLPVGVVKSVPLLFEGGEDVSIDSSEAQERPVSLVGVVRIGGQQEGGWTSQLFLLGLINVFVGIFNLVPLLPFDGGHAAIATYERIRSRKGQRYRADMAKAIPILYGTALFLAILMISSVWLDIVRPIG